MGRKRGVKGGRGRALGEGRGAGQELLVTLSSRRIGDVSACAAAGFLGRAEREVGGGNEENELKLEAPSLLHHPRQVSRIIASGEESKSFWQTNDYKSFSPNVDWDSVDWDSAPPVYKMPVTSAICEPAPGTVVDDDEVTGGCRLASSGCRLS